MQMWGATTEEVNEYISGAVQSITLHNICRGDPNDSRLPKNYDPYSGLRPHSLKEKGLASKAG